MISMNKRYAFCLTIVLFSIGLICSCDKPAKPDGKPEAKPDAREELVRALKGANVEGFHFATTEDETREAASLTNPAAGKQITLDSKTTNLALRYTSIKDKKANSTKTYKTEIARTGTAFELLITDIVTGEVFLKKAFQDDDNTNPPEPPTGCGSTESCSDFECKKLPAFQCEANKKCEAIMVGTICCLNGGLVSIHYIVRPNKPLCILKDLIPDLEGFVLSRD